MLPLFSSLVDIFPTKIKILNANSQVLWYGSATQSIIKTQQSDPSTFLFRTHARLSRARVSNTLLSWVEIWVRPPRILYGLTHYRGEKSDSFIKWKIETAGVCY